MPEEIKRRVLDSYLGSVPGRREEFTTKAPRRQGEMGNG